MNRSRQGDWPGRACLLLFFLTTTVSATEPPITAVAFAPGGESVVAVSQSGLHELRWPDLERLRTIKVTASNLHCLTFSPTGKQLAVGGGNPSEDGSVEIFSWPAAESVLVLDGHSDSIRSVVWTEDSKLLTASLDREIKLWDLGGDLSSRPSPPQRRRSLRTYRGHSRSVDALCLLTDGKSFVSAGADQSVRVWELESAKLVRSLNQHTKPVHALAIRPSEGGLPMVASAAGDRTIRLWQPTIGRMVRYVRLEAEPLDIAWTGDGSRVVASCVDGSVRVVDAEDVQVTQTLPAIEGWVYAIAVHPHDGSLVVGGRDGQFRRIKVSSKQP